MRVPALVLLCILVGAAYADDKCSVTIGGVDFRIYGATDNSGDYVYTPASGDWNYYLNVCRGLVQPQTGCEGAAVCQVAKTGSDTWPLGNPNEAVYAGDTGPMLVYDDQSGHSPKRNSIIQFVCDETATTGKITSAAEMGTDPVTFTFTFNTIYACQNAPAPPGPEPSGGGGGGGLSGGDVILIIFFPTVFLYLVIGMVYKRQRMGVEGTEMVPNVDFWRDLPALCKDGAKFLWGKMTGKAVNRSTAEYDSI